MLSRGFRLFVLGSAFFLSLFLITADRSQAQDNTAAAEEEKPYKIDPDGTVDWPTFSGFRRYNSGGDSNYAGTIPGIPRYISFSAVSRLVCRGAKRSARKPRSIPCGFSVPLISHK